MVRRFKALLLGVLDAFYLVSPTISHAQAFPLTQNSFFPIDLPVFIPCAADGQGEYVELTGELHDLFHVTNNAAGGFSIKNHDDPQGVSGTGLTTGDKYQGTGVTQDEITGRVGFQETVINTF